MDNKYTQAARTFLTLLAACLMVVISPHAAEGAPLFLGSTVALGSDQSDNIDKAMKVIFEDPVSENMVTDSELLDLFEEDNNVQTETTTGGRYITLAHYFQLPAGVGARSENDYIPVPEGPVIENSRIDLRKIMGTVEMTGDTMRRCKAGIGAFLDWGSRAMPDLVERVNHERDRMLVGYGTGVKARVNGAPALVSGKYEVTIDSSFGVAGYTDAVLNFMEGERSVFSPNPDGSALRSAGASQSAKLVKVDQKNSKLIFDSLPAGVVDNDFLFAGDASGASVPTAAGQDREIMGLLGMIDDAQILVQFQGLNRNDYTLWNSISVDAQDPALGPWNTGALNEDVLCYADDETRIYGGGRVSVLVTSVSGTRSYWRSRKDEPTTHRTLDPRNVTGGRGRLKILLGDREVELRSIRKLPPQLCFGLSPSTLKRWQLKGWEWDNTTGSVWRQVTDGVGRKDAFYAYGYWHGQTGCIAPRKNFVIRNLLRS